MAGDHSHRRQRLKIDCRNGVHNWGRQQRAGYGILRRSCLCCGMISIDLTEVEDQPVSAFSSGSLSNMLVASRYQIR